MLSIVVPTFNEKPNLSPLLAEIDGALAGIVEYEVVFVDDSTDDTPSHLHELGQKNPNVRYLHRDKGSGLASAVIEGFGLAKGDVIAVMDADLQHPPSLLAPMYKTIAEGADIVLPSRYIDGGDSEGLGFIRTLASKGARLAAQVFLKSVRCVTDPMSGYFMFRRHVVDGARLNPLGWKVLLEVLVLGRYRTVAEIPYRFEKRVAGESKLSFKVTLQYFLHILTLVARSERDRRFYVFVLVGLLGMAVDMAIFFAASSWWNLPANAAATLSACVAMVSNYLLNRGVTWRSTAKRNVRREFARYLAVAGAGVGIKNVFVYFLVRAGVSGAWSNIAGIVAVCMWNYMLNCLWVFRDVEDGGEGAVVYIRKNEA